MDYVNDLNYENENLKYELELCMFFHFLCFPFLGSNTLYNHALKIHVSAQLNANG